jgi:hypothetical protein
MFQLPLARSVVLNCLCELTACCVTTFPDGVPGSGFLTVFLPPAANAQVARFFGKLAFAACHCRHLAANFVGPFELNGRLFEK